MNPRLLAAIAVLALNAFGCRYRRRSSRSPRVAVAAVASMPFATAVASTVRVTATLAPHGLLAPLIAATDDGIAAMTPDGHLRFVTSRAGGAVGVREILAPCRFDPSRHAAQWTLSPRLALDGRGHACCIHDGDATASAGAYCADLRAAVPQWSRARVPGVALGAGSGSGAIALYAADLWCTVDGGRTVMRTYRGEPTQPLTMATCGAHGGAVAVTGTRSPGGADQQTARVALHDGPLTMLAGAPRGEPIAVFALDDRGAALVLRDRAGVHLIAVDAAGAVHLAPLELPVHAAFGAWHDGLLAISANRVLLFANGAVARERAIGDDAPLAAVTRVGSALVGVTRSAAMLRLSVE